MSRVPSATRDSRPRPPPLAETEAGAQVLVCSEIGSEGRNFQFSNTLVLFDLPFNPELLEQRIGRLDRIGQQHTIDIYLPFFENTPQQSLVRWYHEGMNAFEHINEVGTEVKAGVNAQLVKVIQGECEDIAPLLESTSHLYQQALDKITFAVQGAGQALQRVWK